MQSRILGGAMTKKYASFGIKTKAPAWSSKIYYIKRSKVLDSSFWQHQTRKKIRKVPFERRPLSDFYRTTQSINVFIFALPIFSTPKMLANYCWSWQSYKLVEKTRNLGRSIRRWLKNTSRRETKPKR